MFALIVYILYFVAFVPLNPEEHNESTRTQNDTVIDINITNVATKYNEPTGASYPEVSKNSYIFCLSNCVIVTTFIFIISTEIFNFIM